MVCYLFDGLYLVCIWFVIFVAVWVLIFVAFFCCLGVLRAMVVVYVWRLFDFVSFFVLLIFVLCFAGFAFDALVL